MSGPKYASKVTVGPIVLPLFGVVYGAESVGKTTLFDSLETMFVGPEVTQKIKGARMPVPTDWTDFKEQLRDLLHPYYEKRKRIVVDSLDHLEQYLFEWMKQKWKVTAVEDAGGSFGKWVGIAQREWLEVLAICEKLRIEKNKDVIFLAHCEIKVFNDPLTSKPYDRYRMKINDKCAAIIREKVDFVFFANFKTHVASEARDKKGKGVSDGARICYTEKRASHDAKNRFSMPAEIPFDYATVMKYVNATPVEKIVEVQKDIEALILDVKDQEKLAQIRPFYEQHKNDYETLVNIKNSLKVIVGEILYEAE